MTFLTREQHSGEYRGEHRGEHRDYFTRNNVQVKNMEVKKTASQLLQEVVQKRAQEKIADHLKIASLEVENKLLREKLGDREELRNNNQQSTSLSNMVYEIGQYAPVLIGIALLVIMHYWK
ncbi:unnamed protein product [Rotaria sp. Silwood1]|nr:unnamed protein product [Rotaria sp. Silwood1]